MLKKNDLQYKNNNGKNDTSFSHKDKDVFTQKSNFTEFCIFSQSAACIRSMKLFYEIRSFLKCRKFNHFCISICLGTIEVKLAIKTKSSSSYINKYKYTSFIKQS